MRKICLALPDTTEVAAWGEPTFRVGGRIFAMFASAGTHHSQRGDSVWLMSTRTNQSLLIGRNPKRYFSPPYVGPSGWIGVRLDGRVNWRELEMLVEDAYELRGRRKEEGGRRKEEIGGSQ